MLVSTDKGLRHNEGKVKVELIPPRWIIALAEVLTKGAEKYEERNWEKGMEWSKCYSAAQRHLLAFWGGEDNDQETGLPHVAHAAWNCLALLTYAEYHQDDDDRPGEFVAKSVEQHTDAARRAFPYRPCPVHTTHPGHSWCVAPSPGTKGPVYDYWCGGVLPFTPKPRRSGHIRKMTWE